MTDTPQDRAYAALAIIDRAETGIDGTVPDSVYARLAAALDEIYGPLPPPVMWSRGVR